MRILTISNLYPPHALGGYEKSCADVMQRFGEAGHEIRVLTTETTFPDVPADGPDQHDVRRVLRWYWRDHRIVKPNRWRARRIDAHNLAQLDSTIDEFRPDVVSAWAMGGLSMSLLDRVRERRLPSVWMLEDEWPVYGPRIDAFRARTGAAAPSPDEATLCWASNWLRDRVLADTRWQPGREQVTGIGIDDRDFPLREPVADRPWGWRLLAVGRVEPRKGFATAVAALAHLPNEATLRIAGPADPRHTKELLSVADRVGAGDRVSIAPVARHELADTYAAADALLFTSAWSEPFGLVPLEAMASGTPVVAMPTGGAAEFLHDGANCLTVPVGDASALAAACRRLADDVALRRTLRTGGAATAAEHTMQRFAETLQAAHAQAVAA